jgi:tetratricopeptide (TPR) repeat protein
LSWELWRALRVAGRETDATGALDQAEADAATSGSSAVSARVMVDRALQHLHAGVTTPRETEDQLLGAIAVLGQLGDERGLAIACLGVHAALQFSGRNAEAADAARRARDHYERAGFSPAAALACQAQDLVYGPDPVRKAIAECNAIRASTTDRASAANVMAVLGTLLGLDGRVAEGRTVSDQGLEIYEDLGYHRGIHLIWAPVRIELERAAGSLAEAARLGQAAYEAIEELGFRGFAGTQAAYLAAVLLELGNAADAAHFLDVARSEVPTYDVQVVAVLHAVEARILSSRRRFRQAEERAREAVELADATDNLTDRARIHLALADVLRQRGGRDEEADDAVTEARRLFRRKGNRAALARILDGHRAAIEA